MIKPIIISPPFGTHINVDWATSVKGTHTAYPRPGNRILKALKTLRPIHEGWVNNIGLINEGVDAADYSNPDHIYSVAAVDALEEWYHILGTVPGNRIIELNVSCPNAHKTNPNFGILGLLRLKFKLVIVKLPPFKAQAMPLVDLATQVGITHFHCCNTIPTPRGGISGRKLKPYSLHMINDIKKKYPNVTIIGGGGIYDHYDVKDYWDAGATHFSLSTIWFKPWQVLGVKKAIEEKYG